MMKGRHQEKNEEMKNNHKGPISEVRSETSENEGHPSEI